MNLKKRFEVKPQKTNRVWTQADCFSRGKLIEHSAGSSQAEVSRTGGIFGEFSLLPIINTAKNSLEPYESLQSSYQQLVKENLVLKSKQPVNAAEDSEDLAMIPEHSLQSLALEIEELYSTLSDSHQSLQVLLYSCSLILEQSSDLQKKCSQLKFKKELEEYTKVFKISLETLRRVTEEVKWMKRERERVEGEVKSAQAERKELEKEVKVKEGKVKAVEGRVSAECLQVAELYYRLTAASWSGAKKGSK